eukprot:6186583-Pleurochrysis_carterae.AAC.1
MASPAPRRQRLGLEEGQRVQEQAPSVGGVPHLPVADQMGQGQAPCARAPLAVGRVDAQASVAAEVLLPLQLQRGEILSWGQNSYEWDGHCLAPRGVRERDTHSWLLCPLIADALQWPVFPVDLAPRPTTTASR